MNNIIYQENQYVVIGVGININDEEIPDEIKHIASTLKIESSRSIQREPASFDGNSET